MLGLSAIFAGGGIADVSKRLVIRLPSSASVGLGVYSPTPNVGFHCFVFDIYFGDRSNQADPPFL